MFGFDKNKFDKRTVYGYVKSADGTEFEIVNRRYDFDREVEKLKSKIDSAGMEPPETVLSLYNNGEYFGAEDVLSIPFVFDDESPERDCKNFLKFLQFASNIASVMSNSRFNKIIISEIISTPAYLTDSVKREMAHSQDIFEFREFIDGLSPDIQITLFTENPHRTKENMLGIEDTIKRCLCRILESNTNNQFSFGYKELDLLDGSTELCVLLRRMSEEYFDGKFSFESIRALMEQKLEDRQMKILQKIDDISFLIDSIKQADIQYSGKDVILKSFMADNQQLGAEYDEIDAMAVRLQDFFKEVHND